MNLRQKAKSYKKRMEMLENMTLPTRTSFATSETLCHFRITKRLPYDEYEYTPAAQEISMRLHKDEMMREVSEELRKHIEFDNEERTLSLDFWVRPRKV